ncbi:nucleotide-diphospho-sugar transferase [Sunxiuqinia indica]|uniref:nucleotide-diphospho-sugar transferase n=1 Tax=Sunxiuqinia indica TaxID=2692584 RepID=UPI00135A0B5F|nr:nucleotide-diphospho-sugar transferase [Sunxiuqinia indica]
MNAPYNIPVLLILFNRPDTTRRVFEKIKAIKPKFLFIAADGPRIDKPDEKELCESARSIVDEIDWDCDLKTFFRTENVGCGRGPSEAITWFFEHVEMGIILEDDCVPSLPFFNYCEKMLIQYEKNEQVWIVSGRSHYTKSNQFNTVDYLFSNYALTWGWATWKRCWKHFDIHLENHWPDFYRSGGYKNVYLSRVEGYFWNFFYSRLYREKNLATHVWDFQFAFCMHLNRGLTIIPAKNLIKNIGCDGTHFAGATKALNLRASEVFSIENEPTYILPNRNYELYHFTHDFIDRLLTFIRNRIRKIINKVK